MRVWIVSFLFLYFAALSEENNNFLKDALNINNNYFIINLPKELTDQLNDKVINLKERDGSIMAVVNDYVDKLLDNLQHFIIRNGLDPVELPNNTLNLIPTGTIELSSGWLQDTSTISRNGDVSVSYSSSTKNMEFYVPIKFDALMFTYKYHTKILLLSIKGDADGKVTSLKINVKLSFNYDTFQASLDSFDIADTGDFSLKFTGNDLVDWITNTMTSVVSLFLHPVIVLIIQSMIKGPLESVVETVDSIIKNILNL